MCVCVCGTFKTPRKISFQPSVFPKHYRHDAKYTLFRRIEHSNRKDYKSPFPSVARSNARINKNSRTKRLGNENGDWGGGTRRGLFYLWGVCTPRRPTRPGAPPRFLFSTSSSACCGDSREPSRRPLCVPNASLVRTSRHARNGTPVCV